MSAFGLKKVPKIASTSKGIHGNWEWIYLKFSTCRLIGKWEKKWTNPGTYGTSPDAFFALSQKFSLGFVRGNPTERSLNLYVHTKIS